MEETIKELTRVYYEIKASAIEESEKKRLLDCALELVHHYHRLAGISCVGTIKAEIPLPEFLKVM